MRIGPLVPNQVQLFQGNGHFCNRLLFYDTEDERSSLDNTKRAPYVLANACNTAGVGPRETSAGDKVFPPREDEGKASRLGLSWDDWRFIAMSCLGSFRVERLSAALRPCRLISMALAAISLTAPVFAQEFRASIAGRIADPSDSVVVGA